MHKKIINSASIIASALLSTGLYAFEMGQPITTKALITNSISMRGMTATKEVKLMNIKLTSVERNKLFSYHPKKYSISKNNTELPASVDLGMENVPVLDQGAHGSCATFANTAAINAVLGNGDYVSQLCHLSLGKFLEKQSYYPSGWDGSFAPIVLDQITRFGIISIQNQKTNSCGQLKEYPLMDPKNQGHAMSLRDFKTLSEDITDKVYWTQILSVYERFTSLLTENNKVDNVLNSVKQFLAKGSRVTFGTFIVISPYCSAGACASYRAQQDTWALTKEIETPPYGTAGHEMIIIGYDDNAIAVDGAGNKHQGLLTLRNSWGTEVGNQGDFYMTYDYFKKFVMEAQAIVGIKSRGALRLS